VPALPGSDVTTIDVKCDPEADRWACAVTLADERGRSVHQVGVARRDLERLAPGATAPDDLVRRSFEFLLEREARHSILAAFDLPLIGRYFPEYEATIIATDV
jgi:hypothetical protein